MKDFSTKLKCGAEIFIKPLDGGSGATVIVEGSPAQVGAAVTTDKETNHTVLTLYVSSKTFPALAKILKRVMTNGKTTRKSTRR